ncbi:DUF4153 domain-containing protein [Clostridium sp. D2Q-11]|uniref:DUF4153 domain-containing protein n=1 Tax=Anaeromonas frigoriresistens TaxID=2683708 RepID=A0A942UVV4_9FIRM|nr:DUF4153 domain-containing protein [Anaeromonas frigoriresistens]MBS4539010.1 DUF4153 domain-containing protein [Anaeromonas frigoriresistens]
MNISQRFKDLYNKLYDSFKRFPLALLYAALTVGVSIYLNHLGYIGIDDKRDMFTRIGMVLALGVPLSLSLYMLFESKPHIKKNIKIIAHLGTAIVLVGYYLLLLRNLEYVSGTRYIAYTIALYLIFSFIPYIRRKENYELYVIRLFSRFVVTYVYSMVLYLGLAAILGTINLLFDAGISGRVFADIAFIVAGIFAPTFFLADVPRREEEISVVDYPKVIRVLLQFIVLPLLSVYTIILYIYFAKIIVTMELPQGIIGNLVLWYSIVSTIVLFFIYPLKKSNQWIRYFILIFPKAIIPLLGMMFLALGIRINAYGITEDRYFVLIIGLWITGIMIYYSIKKDIRNIILTITLSIIAILSVTGPWSAYSISKWSQNDRLEEVLERYDMIDENNEIKSPPIEKELSEIDKEIISSVILYFDRNYDLEDIKYLPEDVKISDIKDIFGFELKDDRMGYPAAREYFGYNLDKMNNLVDISDFDYFGDINVYPYDNIEQEQGDYTIEYNNSDRKLVVKNKEDILYTKNLEEVVELLHKQNQGKGSLEQEKMTFIEETKDIKIQIVFKHIHGYEDRAIEEVVVESVEFYSFIKFK